MHTALVRTAAATRRAITVTAGLAVVAPPAQAAPPPGTAAEHRAAWESLSPTDRQVAMDVFREYVAAPVAAEQQSSAAPVRIGGVTGTARLTVVDDAGVALDQALYTVGDEAFYTVVGPPNSPIFWSSTLRGRSTGEVSAFYGHYTDESGRWSAGAGGGWTTANIGLWTKSVRVGGSDASTRFAVKVPPRVPREPIPSPYPCP